MSEDIQEAPKRRGRPKGSKTKRHDPPAAPINGDYEKDVVLNKDPGKRYAWLTTSGVDSDASRFRHRGYVKTENTANGPRPAWDNDADVGSGFTVGGLTLFEVDEDHAAKLDERTRAPSERRMQAIKAAAEANGGYMTRTLEK
jgi:hypothetical protein